MQTTTPNTDHLFVAIYSLHAFSDLVDRAQSVTRINAQHPGAEAHDVIDHDGQHVVVSRIADDRFLAVAKDFIRSPS